MTSQEKDSKSAGEVSPHKDPVFPMWQLERQVAEQLRRGVRTADGSDVAISVGSSMFTYIRKVGNDLIVKYVDCCIAVSVSAKLVGEEMKVHDITVHNICNSVDL